MSCADIERRVALYAGGDLDDASARDVEGHLAACADCRELLTALRVQREAMADSKSAALAEDDLDDVRRGALAAIARGDARPRILDSIRFPPWRRVAWGSAGLAAAALLVFGVWVSTSPTRLVQPVRDAAAPPGREAAQAAAVLPTPDPAPAAAQGDLRTDARRAEARGGTPGPPSRATTAAEEAPVARPRPEAARTSAAGASLLSGSRETLAEIRTAAETSNVSPGAMRRIEFQTADPNIRIIWLVQGTAPEPDRFGAARR